MLFTKKLLTNFNSERWTGINMDSVEKAIDDLNLKIKEIGVLYGEIARDTSEDGTDYSTISLSKAAIALYFLLSLIKKNWNEFKKWS